MYIIEDGKSSLLFIVYQYQQKEFPYMGWLVTWYGANHIVIILCNLGILSSPYGL